MGKVLNRDIANQTASCTPKRTHTSEIEGLVKRYQTGNAEGAEDDLPYAWHLLPGCGVLLGFVRLSVR
jgi:hypothetical protein